MSTSDHLRFDPDDARLTAYALDELPDPGDRAHVEALLAASPEARAELADIRALTASLTAEYEQERQTADAPTPANVIRLPEQRRGWSRQSLAMAAVLLLTGYLVLSLRIAYKPVVIGDPIPALRNSTPADAFKRFEKLAKLGSKEVPAQATPEPIAQIALAQATPAPAALLAAAGPLTPPASFDLQAPGAIGGQAAPMDRDAYYGANAIGNRSLLAEASRKPESVSLDKAGEHMIISGSNIPTGEITAGDAPAQPMLSQSEATAPRQVARTAFPAAASAKRASAPGPGKAEAATLLGSNTYTGAASVAPSLAKGGVEVADQRFSAFSLRDAEVEADELKVLPRSAPVIGAGSGTVTITVPEEMLGRDKRARESNTASYDHVAETPFLTAKENPLSTFSVDVDTASYSIVRRFIEQGSLPPAAAVRIEEMLNYFPYDYAPPGPGDEHPFAVRLEGAACPWNPDHRLVRVALKGREIARDKRPPSNLVFLLDVSGSMEPAERLPLIKESLRLLVEKLTDNDRVAIVVYAGNSGLVLPSTDGTHKDAILRALEHLQAGGSTNGASGIRLAYKVAQENFLKEGTNRVILATDGDFNVGTTSQGELVRLIEKEARGGVFLSVLGVGTDNLKDSTMQKLADHGNGNYAYLDGIAEGKKVLVEQMSGTLVTIAKDVKIQVEFNPAAVNSYRLVGYEKRLLRKEDFNDDRVDAGEIGAGHSVTALYEVIPLGRHDAGAAPGVDALKYGAVMEERPVRAVAKPGPTNPNELLTVKIRHKAPDSDTSVRSYEVAFVDDSTANDYANASPDFKFAAAVATFGLVLRDSPYKGIATLAAAIELAQEGKGADASGYRAGFIELARKASKMR